MKLRPATPADHDPVSSLLEKTKLVPVDELGPHYAIAEEDGSLCGVAGVEPYGDSGLLRSVAVEPSARSRGIGRLLAEDRIAWAAQQGISTLYLLTDTAAGYWLRFGFEPVARHDAPAAVQASHEWRSACPASATAMRLRLRA